MESPAPTPAYPATLRWVRPAIASTALAVEALSEWAVRPDPGNPLRWVLEIRLHRPLSRGERRFVAAFLQGWAKDNGCWVAPQESRPGVWGAYVHLSALHTSAGVVNPLEMAVTELLWAKRM